MVVAVVVVVVIEQSESGDRVEIEHHHQHHHHHHHTNTTTKHDLQDDGAVVEGKVDAENEEEEDDAEGADGLDECFDLDAVWQLRAARVSVAAISLEYVSPVRVATPTARVCSLVKWPEYHEDAHLLLSSSSPLPLLHLLLSSKDDCDRKAATRQLECVLEGLF